jgi:S-DNA-T family DNA segregation ATPase FtsK/SpoIIIE
VLGRRENDMVLGTRQHGNGAQSTMHGWKDKGIGYLIGEGPDARNVRTVYLDGPPPRKSRYGHAPPARRPGCLSGQTGGGTG